MQNKLCSLNKFSFIFITHYHFLYQNFALKKKNFSFLIGSGKIPDIHSSQCLIIWHYTFQNIPK